MSCQNAKPTFISENPDSFKVYHSIYSEEREGDDTDILDVKESDQNCEPMFRFRGRTDGND